MPIKQSVHEEIKRFQALTTIADLVEKIDFTENPGDIMLEAATFPDCQTPYFLKLADVSHNVHNRDLVKDAFAVVCNYWNNQDYAAFNDAGNQRTAEKLASGATVQHFAYDGIEYKIWIGHNGTPLMIAAPMRFFIARMIEEALTVMKL